MSDYITCGICGEDYELGDINRFISHKSTCAQNHSQSNLPLRSKNILECVKCFRKFNTPWSLLLHIQLDHKMNVVRNLCLPEDRTTTANNNSQNLTPKVQQPYNAATALKNVTMRTIETQTRTTCVQKAKCMAVCCQKSSGDNQCCSGCDKDDCNCNTKPTCCLPQENLSEMSPVSQPSNCCPCPHPIKAETKTTDCQTDFEYLDFDMDLFLDENSDIATGIANPVCTLQGEAATMISQQPLSSVSATMSNAGTITAIQNEYNISPFANTSQLITSDISSQPMEASMIDTLPITIPSDPEILSKNHSQMLPTTESELMWHESSLVNSMNDDSSLSIMEHQMDPSLLQTLSSTSATTAGTVSMTPNGLQSLMTLPQDQMMTRRVTSSGSYSPSLTRTFATSTHYNGQSSQRKIREYRFNCAQCGKLFRQNVHLRKHTMSQHTKVKPHECPHCGYTTVEKSHLTVHIRTHTGEKPYRCRNCTYSSAQNCTLKSHYLRRHPGSSVICQSCGEIYITEQERNNHQKACKEISSSME